MNEFLMKFLGEAAYSKLCMISQEVRRVEHSILKKDVSTF